MRRVTIDFMRGGSFSMSDNKELDVMSKTQAAKAVTQQARLNGFTAQIRSVTIKENAA